MMKTQKIKINNFKAVKSAEIDIKKTVVLIGEQASGKSTIAKVVYFFKSIKDDYLDVISENITDLNSQKDITDKLWAAIGKKFYRFFGSIQHLPSFEICYTYSEDKMVTLKQEKKDGKKSLDITFSPDSFYTDITKSVLDHIKKIQEISTQRNLFTGTTYRAALKELSSYVEYLFQEPRQLIFIPAGRNITVTYPDFFRFNFAGSLSSELALIKDESKDENEGPARFVEDTYLMTQFVRWIQTVIDTFKGRSFESFLERISNGKNQHNYEYAAMAMEKIEQILKGKYNYDGHFGEQILFDDKDYVHLSNASSGQQEVIRILQDIFLVLINQEKAFRVIEEPEAHLFPTGQKRLIETIALMLNATDSQIFLTTHSPYILSIFTNLLFASSVNNEVIEEKTIPVHCRLKSSETSVYALLDGESKSIIDKETGLIEQNALDSVSEELAGEFDFMYTRLVEKRRMENG